MKRLCIICIVCLSIGYQYPVKALMHTPAPEKKRVSNNSLSGQIEQLLELLPPGAVSSVLVKKAVSGEVVFNKAGNLNLIPASTLKILTTVAAYDKLGADYRYPTRLLLSRNIGRSRIYKGGILIAFSGDPSLKSRHLEEMLAILKKKGVREIVGDIWLDDTVFSGYPKAEGVVWNDLGICFAAPSTGMILDRNCFYAWLKPGREGKKTIIRYDQPGDFQKIENQIITRQSRDGLQCQPKAWPSSDYEYRLTGCLEPGQKPLRLAFAVKHYERYMKKKMASMLKGQGLLHRGRIVIGKPGASFPVLLAEHQSDSLAGLLKPVLERSDNLFSDSLMKTLGHKVTGFSGSYERGTDAIIKVLGDKGIDLSHSHIADGSGLSRYNLISASTLADVLAMAWREWGSDSPWLINRPYKDRWFKTGTMKGVSAVAGYIFPSGSEPLLFVVMVNGLVSPKKAARESFSSPVEDIRQFRYELMDRLANSAR
ncbi:D-alanyl-D-alanine carboxypeptidase/D-alanyl-D-alanine-endopeptidase [Endozoicomonas sp. Mp262]|uniref:D-alanyl-D-alanine carboxypeptidase/D-alanyl-D-alanine endopeptidase n=1 Tax=Endozoicomonas sp. Mp262 TaxID=2919499 RepID=UPI0021E0D034